METRNHGWVVWFLTAFGVMILTVPFSPRQGWAVTGDEICNNIYNAGTNPTGVYDPNGDEDRDGYTNSEECNGQLIVLRFRSSDNTCQPNVNGLRVKDAAGVELLGYRYRGTVDRTKYLDPSSPDVLFTWEPGIYPPSPLPTAPLTWTQFTISDLGSSPLSYYNAGLGLTTHQITLDNTCGKNTAISTETRYVTYHNPPIVIAGLDNNYGQKAVKVREDTTVGSALGVTTQGTPVSSGGSAVYTQKIYNVVNTNCNTGFGWNTKNRVICRTSTTVQCKGSCATAAKLEIAKKSIFLEYVKNVLNHEVSHATNLAQPWSCTDEFHQPGGTGYLMEKNIQVTTSGDIVFFISRQYTSVDTQYDKLTGPGEVARKTCP